MGWLVLGNAGLLAYVREGHSSGKKVATLTTGD